jgi:ribosome modulation factor
VVAKEYCGLSHHVCVGPYADVDTRTEFPRGWKDGGIISMYGLRDEKDEHIFDHEGRILGSVVMRVTELLAYRDVRLRNYASYLDTTSMWTSIGPGFYFRPNELTCEVLERLKSRGYSEQRWSEWRAYI